jgi:2-keto-4-pentenoate hydratase
MALSLGMRTSIADEVFDAMSTPREIVPFSVRYPGFDMSDAYAVVEDIRSRRETRGERVVGRKIGFTNRKAWADYNISGPIWNYLYLATTLDLSECGAYPIGSWPNVRMETEVALGLHKAPTTAMNEDELLRCVEWAALDFEICASVFPDWRFQAADAATTGVHVALLLGERRVLDGDREVWAEELASLTVRLSEAGGASADGGGVQVLGSPIKALRLLIQELARFGGDPIRAGEVVTTGTLTKALPAAAGQVWRAEPRGTRLAGLQLSLI